MNAFCRAWELQIQASMASTDMLCKQMLEESLELLLAKHSPQEVQFSFASPLEAADARLILAKQLSSGLWCGKNLIRHAGFCLSSLHNK